MSTHHAHPPTDRPHPLRTALAGRAPTMVRIDAGAAVDAGVVALAPASLLLEVRSIEWAQVLRLDATIVATDSPGAIDGHPRAHRAARVDLRDCVLLPGLVNAHTHLDLTHIGPRAHDPAEGFVSWVDHVRRERLRDDDGIAGSVRLGIDLSLAGGTVAVGDIAGAPGGIPSLAPLSALRDSPLIGVSFLEFFAIGKGEQPGLARVRSTIESLGPDRASGRVRAGIQPHAPNTVSLRAYREATALARGLGLPVCTHLAETREEREFVSLGSGPQRELLERLGVWDDSIAEEIGRGLSPVAHLGPILNGTGSNGGSSPGVLAVHLNDVSDADIEILRASGTRAVYCPRASAYFGSADDFGPHRYRDLLEAGVPVALGTDSILNLPTAAADPRAGGMSILDEMRLLSRRDGTDARTLLRMGTVHGAAALSLEADRFGLATGSQPAGMLAVRTSRLGAGAAESLRIAIAEDSAPRLLFCGK